MTDIILQEWRTELYRRGVNETLGVKIGPGQWIYGLFYVDDTLLIGKNSEEVANMVDVFAQSLNKFGL